MILSLIFNNEFGKYKNLSSKDLKINYLIGVLVSIPASFEMFWSKQDFTENKYDLPQKYNKILQMIKTVVILVLSVLVGVIFKTTITRLE